MDDEGDEVGPDEGVGEASDALRYASLEEALRRRRIPLENHALIRRFVEGLDISEFHGTSAYIRAVRRAGGPDIRIASGWSNGFISQDEILGVAGDVSSWPSGRGKGDLWGLSHPRNGGDRSGSGGASAKRDYGTCPECTMTIHANRTCGCD